MRIIALSDTHIPRRAKELPRTVLAALADADHIIHAGDITAPHVLDALAVYAPVTAVSGNADPPELQDALRRKAAAAAGRLCDRRVPWTWTERDDASACCRRL